MTVALTERQFQAQIVQLARLCGWLVHHHQWSMQSAPGWPDLALCRPGFLVLAELKVGRNQPSPAQQQWLDVLGTVPGVTATVWRPDDWQEIQALLTAAMPR